MIVQIIRGNDHIVPYGDTLICKGDNLIISGSKEYIDVIRTELR